jgi:hypothetical protein
VQARGHGRHGNDEAQVEEQFQKRRLAVHFPGVARRHRAAPWLPNGPVMVGHRHLSGSFRACDFVAVEVVRRLDA